jgi:hypothetical protein
MSTASLSSVAEAVLRLAKRQGFVVARDVRSELRIAHLPDDQWKEVLTLLRDALMYRQGRYYHKDSYSPRLQKEHEQQKAIGKLIRRLLKQHRRRSKEEDRRGQARVDFIQPVKVRTEDGKEHTLVSRDLSVTGIRVMGTKRLLGQKVQLELGQPASRLVVRILWTCALGDDLFENGGSFVEVL